MAFIKEKRLGLLPKKIEPLLFSVLPSCLPDTHRLRCHGSMQIGTIFRKLLTLQKIFFYDLSQLHGYRINASYRIRNIMLGDHPFRTLAIWRGADRQ